MKFKKIILYIKMNETYDESISEIIKDLTGGKLSKPEIMKKYHITKYYLEKLMFDNDINMRKNINKYNIGKPIIKQEIQPENNKEIKQGFNIEEYEKVETEKQRKFYGLNK